MNDNKQVCKICGGSFTVRSLVERIAWYWPEVDAAVSESPCCHIAEELRIEHKKVWRGYVSASGAPHFCGMEEYEAPNLSLKRKNPELVFVLDGVEHLIRTRG